MFTVSLAPTSTPSRWYSKPLGIQEEYDELAFLEAKFVHEREQALVVHCQVVYPVTSSNNNSLEDPSTDEAAMQDDSNDRGVLPSTEMDGTSLDDRTLEAPNYHTPDQPYGEQHDLLDYLQHRGQYNQNSNNNNNNSNTHGSSRTTTRRYSTPSQMNDFYTTPTNPSHSPGDISYLPPPPAGRSLRQYLDDSSRGFIESIDVMDRLVRFDDDDDNNDDDDGGSYGGGDPMHVDHEDDYYQQRDIDNDDLSSPTTRRSNFFD